ncbi:hypothetical protein [Nonomuraea basaltis]|nr:hypothetical protein [Nonomuraea basaltis]
MPMWSVGVVLHLIVATLVLTRLLGVLCPIRHPEQIDVTHTT